MSANGHGDTRQRWPREERERFIIERAADLFAERGFGLTTRELASALGVTQALLYQYFDTKQALIDRVFEATFLAPHDTVSTEVLADQSRSLEDRLVEFYEHFVGQRLTPTRQRLFLRANLDGLDLARRYRSPLDERVLKPLIAALRTQAGQPGLDTEAMTSAERELAMTLHGSIMVLGLRKHVYGTESLGALETHVRSHVRTFLYGALQAP